MAIEVKRKEVAPPIESLLFTENTKEAFIEFIKAMSDNGIFEDDWWRSAVRARKLFKVFSPEEIEELLK